MTAVTHLDPLVSEFDTAEQEAAHTAWIRAELERRQNQPGPLIPHDEVMRRAEERIDYWRQQQKAA